jgi:DNA polymerase-3 subunit epsilon
LETAVATGICQVVVQANYGARPRPLCPRITEAERLAHEAFVRDDLSGSALWLRVQG